MSRLFLDIGVSGFCINKKVVCLYYRMWYDLYKVCHNSYTDAEERTESYTYDGKENLEKTIISKRISFCLNIIIVLYMTKTANKQLQSCSLKKFNHYFGGNLLCFIQTQLFTSG